MMTKIRTYMSEVENYEHKGIKYSFDITVNLNTRMRSCGGRAFYNNNHIHINYRLFNDNEDNDLRNTFTHELAHLIAHHIYNRSNWQIFPQTPQYTCLWRKSSLS